MISEDVRRFVLTSMPSIPHLEAVLLFRDDPSTVRTEASVARALYVTEQAASAILRYLSAIGCLQRLSEDQTGYRYMPRDPTMYGLLAQLAAAYRVDMIGVTHLIHDTTQKNAHRFADAFKIKKEN